MRCHKCGQKFVKGDEVLPVLEFDINHREREFVTFTPHAYIHIRHLSEIPVIG